MARGEQRPSGLTRTAAELRGWPELNLIEHGLGADLMVKAESTVT